MYGFLILPREVELRSLDVLGDDGVSSVTSKGEVVLVHPLGLDELESSGNRGLVADEEQSAILPIIRNAPTVGCLTGLEIGPVLDPSSQNSVMVGFVLAGWIGRARVRLSYVRGSRHIKAIRVGRVVKVVDFF